MLLSGVVGLFAEKIVGIGPADSAAIADKICFFFSFICAEEEDSVLHCQITVTSLSWRTFLTLIKIRMLSKHN